MKTSLLRALALPPATQFPSGILIILLAGLLVGCGGGGPEKESPSVGSTHDRKQRK